MKKTPAKPLPFRLLVLLLAGAALTLLFLALRKPAAQREDYRQIASRTYDTAFLSMYPTQYYSDEDFRHYLGLEVFRASYCMPGISVMEEYLEKIAASGNAVTTVYLGIRPDKTELSDFRALTAKYPSVAFEIILSYPSLDYWTGLSEKAYAQALAGYAAFLSEALDIPNVHLFFLGHREWLVANPGCYEDKWTVKSPIAKTILLESTILGEHFVTAENAALFYAGLESLTRKARTAPESFPDLSDYAFVFFGDSVIGNYTDSASIPGVVSGLSGAAVYNCGYGGNSAAQSSKFPVFLPGIADAFVRGDLSLLPQGEVVRQGVSSYLRDYPPGAFPENLVFVINYGLNDYFDGHRVDSESDPMDTATYSGAIRTAVATLRTAYPDARVILCTPSYCRYYENGTLPHGEGGYILTDYVDAILSLSEELHTDVLDTYHDLGADSGNWDQYLSPDQVHPNASYRYLIGKSLIRLLP
ncbi:MAG: SGNH/GDSL hydrolase family protein [Lachnospiraceae bacterium]|nr:SGNH/GDSL hydrolase family protein [Lachnospiraceae bacterium]